MKKDPVNENIAQDKMLRMDCSQFADALHELDRPGTPGAAVREGALAHAETCSDCGALVTEAESLDFALGQISQQASDLQAPPRIEAALLREFRREKSQAASRRLHFQLAVVGIAAAILLVLGLTFHRPRPAAFGKTPSVSASAVAPASSRLRSREHPTSTVPANNASIEPRATRSRAQAEKAATSNSDATEYATAYVPLPYAYDPSDLEGGAVVRVVLPRAALISYGLPVEAMGVSDQVTADMVVSEDGTPQAIRLVAQGTPATDD
ncbi:MAG: hypothetical protein WA197_13190 [Candidatus Acidiferrales bacterium]